MGIKFPNKNDNNGMNFGERDFAYKDTLDGITLNVKDFGAIGDGIADDTEAIQKAVDTLGSLGGGVLYYPTVDGFYNISTEINLCSNVRHKGSSDMPTIKNVTTNEVNIFKGENITNVALESLTIQNGESTTGGHLGADKCGLFTNNVTKLRINNVTFKEISGKAGASLTKTSDIIISDSVFYKMTYSGLYLFEETQDITVQNTTFDTVTTLVEPNAYLLVTGVNNFIDTHSFKTRNLHIYNCKFLNNPRWEGIDTHGCKGFYCKDNYIENVAHGIVCAYDYRSQTPFEHSDIYIENNIIEKGASSVAGNGIVVQGNEAGDGEFAENINIFKNKIIGEFGNFNTDYTAGIRLDNLKDFSVENNTCDGNMNKSLILTNCIYGDIFKNKIYNTKENVGGFSHAIRFWNGCYIINFNDNIIKNITEPRLQRGVYNTNKGLVAFKGNMIEANTEYHVFCALMNGSVTSAKLGKSTIYAKTQQEIITHWCTDEVIRSTAQATALTVSGSSGSNVLTSSENVLKYICIGEEITIPNADTGSGTLTTTVSNYINSTTFEISDDLVETINNEIVSTTESTWAS